MASLRFMGKRTKPTKDPTASKVGSGHATNSSSNAYVSSAAGTDDYYPNNDLRSDTQSEINISVSTKAVPNTQRSLSTSDASWGKSSIAQASIRPLRKHTTHPSKRYDATNDIVIEGVAVEDPVLENSITIPSSATYHKVGDLTGEYKEFGVDTRDYSDNSELDSISPRTSRHEDMKSLERHDWPQPRDTNDFKENLGFQKPWRSGTRSNSNPSLDLQSARRDSDMMEQTLGGSERPRTSITSVSKYRSDSRAGSIAQEPETNDTVSNKTSSVNNVKTIADWHLSPKSSVKI